MSQDNYMPGTNDYDIDDERGFTDDRIEDAFRAGAAQMREMLARFVEHGGGELEKRIAQSMRLNWVPNWGADPGPQDKIHDDLWGAL